MNDFYDILIITSIFSLTIFIYHKLVIERLIKCNDATSNEIILLLENINENKNKNIND